MDIARKEKTHVFVLVTNIITSIFLQNYAAFFSPLSFEPLKFTFEEKTKNKWRVGIRTRRTGHLFKQSVDHGETMRKSKHAQQCRVLLREQHDTGAGSIQTAVPWNSQKQVSYIA